MKKLRQKLESCHLNSLSLHRNKTRSIQMSSPMLDVNFQHHRQCKQQPKQRLKTRISHGRYQALDAKDSPSYLKLKHLTVQPSSNASTASYLSMVVPQSLTFGISMYSPSRTSKLCSCPHFKSCTVHPSWPSILNSEARYT